MCSPVRAQLDLSNCEVLKLQGRKINSCEVANTQLEPPSVTSAFRPSRALSSAAAALSQTVSSLHNAVDVCKTAHLVSFLQSDRAQINSFEYHTEQQYKWFKLE